MNAPAIQSPDAPRPTLLLAATRPEADYVARALGVEMKAATPQWVLAVGGIGGHRTVAALHRAVRQKQVGRVIQFGFAGALSPALQPGHMEHYVTLAEPSGRMITLEDAVPRVLTKEETPPAGPRLLTVPYVIYRAADKQRLFNYHNAIAVDMESFPVAQACAQLNLPYTLIRTISDPADMTLPQGAESWVDHEGVVRMSRVISHLIFHPRSLPTMLELGRNCKIAGEAMTAQVLEALQQS
jgi:nucleoside phosphorylase